MRLGVSLAYWPPWLQIDEQFALAKLADRLGFESLWVAEGYGQDGVALLGALSSVTDQIGLGAGIMQIPARQPAATAMAASTLDRLSGGRMLLGLGLSGPQVSEGWYGVPFTTPLRRTREYIEVVRKALSGRPLEYEGREWTLPTREGLGLGKPLKLLGTHCRTGFRSISALAVSRRSNRRAHSPTVGCRSCSVPNMRTC